MTDVFILSAVRTAIGGFGGSNHRSGLFGIDGKRLFAQDGFAGGDTTQRLFHMASMWGSHINCIDLRIIGQRLITRMHTRDVVLRSKALS